MRASVGAFAIYLASISFSSCTSTALAKSTTTIENNKTRLRRRTQRNVIDVQIPEKNAASNAATKEDELALFELETAQFASRFLQQSGSGGRRSKKNRDSDDESDEDSKDESKEDSEEESEESESEESESEEEESDDSDADGEEMTDSTATAPARQDDTTEDTGNQNLADPAVIIAENLIPEIKAEDKEEKKDSKTDKKEKDTTDIKFEQAPKNDPSDCSDLSEDQRADAIRKQLSEITDLAVLDNDMTPQGKAFDWITYFDNAHLCPGGSDKHLLSQRYVLATLYFSTSGDDWFACFMSDPNCASTSISVSDFNPSIGGAMGASSWLSGASVGSECSWHGIRCNDDNYVQKLEIANNGLAGVIPQEIASLEKLDVLGLEQNSLIGPIPSGFADGLYRVRLQNNALSGPLPTFPASVLTLQVEENRLSGEITEAVANLPNLKKLNLNDNRFTGAIPTTLGSVSTEVKEIRLHGNKFDGQVPADLCVLRMQNFDFKRLSVDCQRVECECCAPECPSDFNP